MANKIKYKVGCLMEALDSGEVDAAAQQANASNRMGRGIAPLLAKRWPQIREVDQIFSRGRTREEKMGRYSRAILSGGEYFYNLYGQLHWSLFPVEEGRNTNYMYLCNSLQRMEIDLRNKESCKVGFPLIGCGLAGGDWCVVSKLIHDIFIVRGYDVTVYVLEKDWPMVEGHALYD